MFHQTKGGCCHSGMAPAKEETSNFWTNCDSPERKLLWLLSLLWMPALFAVLLSGSEAETTGTLSSLYIVKSLLPSFPFETLLSPLKTHPNPIWFSQTLGTSRHLSTLSLALTGGQNFSTAQSAASRMKYKHLFFLSYPPEIFTACTMLSKIGINNEA